MCKIIFSLFSLLIAISSNAAELDLELVGNSKFTSLVFRYDPIKSEYNVPESVNIQLNKSDNGIVFSRPISIYDVRKIRYVDVFGKPCEIGIDYQLCPENTGRIDVTKYQNLSFDKARYKLKSIEVELSILLTDSKIVAYTKIDDRYIYTLSNINFIGRDLVIRTVEPIEIITLTAYDQLLRKKVVSLTPKITSNTDGYEYKLLASDTNFSTTNPWFFKKINLFTKSDQFRYLIKEIETIKLDPTIDSYYCSAQYKNTMRCDSIVLKNNDRQLTLFNFIGTEYFNKIFNQIEYRVDASSFYLGEYKILNHRDFFERNPLYNKFRMRKPYLKFSVKSGNCTVNNAEARYDNDVLTIKNIVNKCVISINYDNSQLKIRNIISSIPYKIVDTASNQVIKNQTNSHALLAYIIFCIISMLFWKLTSSSSYYLVITILSTIIFSLCSSYTLELISKEFLVCCEFMLIIAIFYATRSLNINKNPIFLLIFFTITSLIMQMINMKLASNIMTIFLAFTIGSLTYRKSR